MTNLGDLSSNAQIPTAGIADNAVTNAQISTSAAIAHTKLANITAGRVLMGDASNIPTATAMSGDVTINSSGVTTIQDDAVTRSKTSGFIQTEMYTVISMAPGILQVTLTWDVAFASGLAYTVTASVHADLGAQISSAGAQLLRISEKSGAYIKVLLANNAGSALNCVVNAIAIGN